MGVYLIVGEDDFLADEAAKRIVGDGTGLETVDSRNSTNEELQLKDLREVDASFSTPPFLEPRKVTWWRNVGFLPGGGEGGEAVKAAVEKFALKVSETAPADNQHLVVCAPRVLMSSVFVKRLKKVAEVIEVSGGGKPWEQAKRLKDRVVADARGMGLSFAPQAVEAFMSRVGGDMRSLRSELEKMRCYLGGGEAVVTVEAISEVTAQGFGVEPTVWGVTDALGERDAEKALAAMRPFESDKGFAVMMTTVIERFFRQLAELKDAVDRGLAARATEGVPPFVVRKNMAFVGRWKLAELNRARARFLNLRERAVSGGESDSLVEIEVVRAVRGL